MINLKWLKNIVFAIPCLVLAATFAQAQEDDDLVAGLTQEAVDRVLQQRVEEAAEEEVSDQVEEQIIEEVNDEVVDALEDELVAGLTIEAVERVLEKSIEEEVAEVVDDAVEDAVEETVEEAVEDTVQEVVEEEIADAVQEQVEEQITDTVTDEVEESVEESVEEQVEESVAANVEEALEEQVEESVAQTVEQGVEQSVEDSVEDTIEQGVEQGVAMAVEQQVETQVADTVAEAVEERLDSEIDDILDGLESDLEVDESRIHKEQWLVMAEPEVFEELAEEGYLFDTVTDLPALGMRLAEVAGLESFDITEVRRGVLDVVGKDRAEVDLNHIYTAGTMVAEEKGLMPRAAVRFPEDELVVSPRIGMIDSLVDTAHPALKQSRIESRSFTGQGAEMPAFHGTAIASIIAADSDDYQGLAPRAEVYAAAVFEKDDERGEIASTVSLLRALDWLISSEVDVVNISLAGPPNRLLETALGRASEQNVLVMAAAGNGGPVAAPMYPAAYDSVVAVTAVDAGHQVFRLANRGEYLDLAAPGVGLLHARAGGGYVASSGTSFAVPFAATAAARLMRIQPDADPLEVLFNSAEDLGPPGRDDIYGYGLLRFAGL